MALVLPIRAVVAVLGSLAVAELALLPRTSPVGAHLAVHVVVLGTLLLLPRRPLAILALLLLEIFLVKELRLNAMVSVALALLAPFAAFAAAALVAPGRLWIVALLLAAHLGWRATLPSGDAQTIVVTATLLAAAALAGALLQRSQRRLTRVEAERDRLRAALADGPGEAATAEQLRMWSEVEQRIEPVIAALPSLIQRAAEGHTRERLEAVRGQASDALRAMQATVRMLGAEPPAPLGPALDMPRRRRVLPALGQAPLALTCAALAFGAALTGATLADLVGVVAVTYDLVALLLSILAGALAGPRRAVAAFVILQAGAAAGLAVDDAMDWPAVSYVSQALLLAGGWSVGALLRGVAVQQRRVAAVVDEVAQALDELVRQAIQRERVRLAHELHDLVGHALTAVALQASAALVQLARGRPVSFEPLLHAATQGVAELERLAAVLQPPTSIAEELERMVAASGQRVVLELPERIELDDDLRHTVVCVAAEALTNAAKHAAGAPIRVSLTHTGQALALRVVDEGGTASGLPSGGNGIASMARRVHAAGGTFVSGPRPGGGWVVSAVLPGDTIARRG